MVKLFEEVVDTIDEINGAASLLSVTLSNVVELMGGNWPLTRRDILIPKDVVDK
jgi:hypothetical protein